MCVYSFFGFKQLWTLPIGWSEHPILSCTRGCKLICIGLSSSCSPLGNLRFVRLAPLVQQEVVHQQSLNPGDRVWSKGIPDAAQGTSVRFPGVHAFVATMVWVQNPHLKYNIARAFDASMSFEIVKRSNLIFVHILESILIKRPRSLFGTHTKVEALSNPQMNGCLPFGSLLLKLNWQIRFLQVTCHNHLAMHQSLCWTKMQHQRHGHLGCKHLHHSTETQVANPMNHLRNFLQSKNPNICTYSKLPFTQTLFLFFLEFAHNLSFI